MCVVCYVGGWVGGCVCAFVCVWLPKVAYRRKEELKLRVHKGINTFITNREMLQFTLHIRKFRSGYVPQMYNAHNEPRIYRHMLLLNHVISCSMIHFGIKIETTVFT